MLFSLFFGGFSESFANRFGRELTFLSMGLGGNLD